MAHRRSYTPEYRAWQTMRLRCTQPTNRAWPNYGARGITVCDRWLNSVENFVADMGPKPSPKHELDRIDNNSGYRPDNCRWVTRSENSRNRRSNRHLIHGGFTRTLREWASLTGINDTTIIARLGSGWSVDRTLTTPARPKAIKGRAEQDARHPCLDCTKPIRLTATRCIDCSNRQRARVAKQ